MVKVIVSIVTTVPHAEQRYSTIGDYRTDTFGTTHFRVSNMGNPDYEFLTSIHEQIEAYICKRAGISEDDIDKFDMEWENERIAGDTSEPGDSPEAPYHLEHMFATKIEKQLAEKLGVNWNDYEEAINYL